ncbi:hypothetical protein G7Y89_g11241 [Cudoniella acicularis]|uniref:Uncharacterized protein n=1 Tax=Cudoniella acicularis TaxID=354080 RepID=A0A8H4RE09_9HELO|nr:hypothetical protein G7Y89_g11241 [Cudoniella acicularis]
MPDSLHPSPSLTTVFSAVRRFVSAENLVENYNQKQKQQPRREPPSEHGKQHRNGESNRGNSRGDLGEERPRQPPKVASVPSRRDLNGYEGGYESGGVLRRGSSREDSPEGGSVGGGRGVRSGSGNASGSDSIGGSGNESTGSNNNITSNPRKKPTTPPNTNTSKPPSKTSTFELTPLSAIIAQSYTDIATLKNLNNIRSKPAVSNALPTSTYVPPNASFVSLPNLKNKNAVGGKGKDKAGIESGEEDNEGSKNGGGGNKSAVEEVVEENLIDFEKIQKNLERFEDLYRLWMKHGDGKGEVGTEVHLVAMVCKEGDVIRGVLDSGVKGRKLPVVKRIVCDCGF